MDVVTYRFCANYRATLAHETSRSKIGSAKMKKIVAMIREQESYGSYETPGFFICTYCDRCGRYFEEFARSIAEANEVKYEMSEHLSLCPVCLQSSGDRK